MAAATARHQESLIQAGRARPHLARLRQAGIDAWYAENNERARLAIRAFPQWCMASKLTGRFQLPQSVIRHAAPLPGRERISQLGRVLTSHDLPLRTRVAVAIVLLYAQPMNPDALAALVNDIGIPTTARRASVIRQHILETPRSPATGQPRVIDQRAT